MKILGIETSCDETAAAVVENGQKILSNIVASSAEFHAKTGGIIPEAAARQQIRSIIPVINQALTASHQSPGTIDAIAVTVGPGLVGSLLVGVETAKTMAYLWNKPIIGVNHLVAHIYANWLTDVGHAPTFPALALIVSGGHTDLILMTSHGKIKPIGTTRDDAAGEAFDKSARLLGLPYPGGPNISKEAERYLEQNHKNLKLNMFPRPMVNEDNLDWSFSGLKTAVLRAVQETINLKQKVPEIAANVQEAIIDSLMTKSIRAIEIYKPKSFLLSGGVAANSRLREKFTRELESKQLKIIFHVPEAKFCTDNAAPIASAAFFNYQPTAWQKINVNPELTIKD